MTRNLLIVILFLSLAGCKSKGAFNYSEDFVKTERSMLPYITKAESDVAEFNKTGQYDSIAVVGERMEKLIDSKLNEFQNKPAPDVKEGENFKKAGIVYFKFLKSIYTDYKNYGKAQTPEERQIAVNSLMKTTSYKETAIAEIKAAQEKFASANGFKVEK